MNARPLNTLWALALCTLALAPVARAQSIDDRLWGAVGTVNALARSGNLLYLGGNFYGVRPDRSNGWSRWQVGSSTVLEPLPGTDFPQANDVESDGMGGWFLGGEFRKVGGLSRTGLARILANGTVASFAPNLYNSFGTGPGTIRNIRRVGGALYFCGNFTHVNGVARPGVAAVNVNTGAVLAYNPPIVPTERVETLEVGPGVVYLAGRAGFASIPGVSVVATNPNSGATVGPIFPTVNTISFFGRVVDVMKRFGNTLYVAGVFDTVGGVSPRRRVAAFDATTGFLTSWNPNLGGENLRVLTIEANASAVYIGGYTTRFLSPFNPFLDARNTTTGAGFGFTAPNFDTTTTQGRVVKALRLSGTKLYMSGNQYVFGAPFFLAPVQELNPTTGAIIPSPVPTPGFIYDIEVDGTTIGVAGQLLDGLEPAPGTERFTALDITTGRPPASPPAFSGDIVELMQLIGSNAFTVEGFPEVVSHDAADGSVNGAYTTLGPVHGLATDGLHLYAAGEWDDSGTPRGYLTRIDPVTMLEEWSISDFDDAVTAITFANNRVYAGGSFLNVAGEFRERGAAFDAAGNLDNDWDPTYTLPARVLAADASGVYAAFPGGTVNSMSPDFGDEGIWSPHVAGEVNAMALTASRVYLGGTFTEVGFSPATNVAATLKVDGSRVNWNVSTDGQVKAMLFDGTDIYIGGAFQNITVAPPAAVRPGYSVLAGGSAYAPAVVRIMDEDLQTGVGDPVVPVAGTIEMARPYPNPSHDQVRLRWTLPRATSMRLDLFDLGGRRVRQVIPSQMMTAGPHEIEVPLAGLGAGLYFARLVGAAGEAATRTVTVVR